MTGLMYREGRSEEYITNELPGILASFESYIKGEWFAGDAITAADFMMYEFLDCAVLYTGQVDYLAVNGYPKLAAFKSKIEEMPSVKAYLSSDRFKQLSGLNNPFAKFR